MARARQAVFVRGNGEVEPVDERFVWDYFHFHPTRKIDPGVLTVVYFDFPTGLRKTWKKWVPKNGRRPAGQPDESVAMRTIDIGGGVMRATVLDLYDWVKRQDAGGIITFQTFTHGWANGPVCWNEPKDWPEDVPLEAPRRQTDTEFRIRDFYGDNPLSGLELVKFNGSFASDAFIKLWGCNHEEQLVQAVNHYLAAAARRNASAAEKKAHLLQYIGTIELSFVAHMARALGRTVWAAPAGWGTDWAIEGTTYRGEFPPDLARGDRWWGPRARFEKKHEAFFRNVLKAKLDACRYVGYDTAWIDDVKRSVTGASAPVSPVKTPRDLENELREQVDQLRL